MPAQLLVDVDVDVVLDVDELVAGAEVVLLVEVAPVELVPLIRPTSDLYSARVWVTVARVFLVASDFAFAAAWSPLELSPASQEYRARSSYWASVGWLSVNTAWALSVVL